MTQPATSLLVQDARTARRNRAEARFRAYGIIAISAGILMLLVLLSTIIARGTGAFQQSFLTLEVALLEEKLDKKGNRNLAEIKKVSTFGYAPLISAAFEAKITEMGIETSLKPKKMAALLSKDAATRLRSFVIANPDQIGQSVTFDFLTQSRVDGYLKGRVSRDSIANDKNISAAQLDLVDALIADGSLVKRFNLDFITGADASDQRPEAAGIGVAMIGSFFMMLVVLVLALPIGVAASIYLEEFAPKNWFTDVIEVNISNLAAVPSIVFGILGLAVFINYMHLPNSAPLVGGLVLTLMTLPTIIISTRAALKAVPPSIRDAALGLGASKLQTSTHHVLPLAMPGILTGSIIAMAQALGETAPLIIIGMNSFIQDPPGDPLDKANVLPSLIYLWNNNSERLFDGKTAVAISILLSFLVLMNALAVVLRKRFERRW